MRHTRESRALIALVAASVVLVSATCGGADGEQRTNQSGNNSNPLPRFDGAAAYELVKRQVAFGPRVPGTPGHVAMADWLQEYLAERADSLVIQRFEHVAVDGETLSLMNLMARFGPSDSRPLLLLAHWDTRPFSDKAEDPADRDTPVPGANDGASGTAVLLQLAEMFRQQAPPRGVDLLFVDGEDYGDFADGRDVFLGSRHFAENLPEDYSPEYGVLLDMVGDRDLALPVEGYSNSRAPEIVDRVWGLAQRMGFGDVFRREVGSTVTDDHLPLNDAGIPTIDIIDFTYPYWHTPDDTPDKLSASSLGVVGSVMTRLIYRGR